MKTSRPHRWLFRLALATSGSALAVAVAAQDPALDRLLASQCSQCQGTQGYAVGDIHSLAGEEGKDLLEDLLDMQSEDRPEDMMDHQALGYTEAQIRRIARYFAALPEDAPRGVPAVRLAPGGRDASGEGSGDDEDYEDRDDDRYAAWRDRRDRDEDDEDEEDEADDRDGDDRDGYHRDRDEDEDDEDEDEDEDEDGEDR